MQKIKIVMASLLMLTHISKAADKAEKQHPSLVGKKYLPLHQGLLISGLTGRCTYLLARTHTRRPRARKLATLTGLATTLITAHHLDTYYSPFK